MTGIAYKIKLTFLVMLAILILVFLGLIIFSGDRGNRYEYGVYVNNFCYVEEYDYAKII